MGITFFQDNVESSDSIQVPFLNDIISANPEMNEQIYQVIKIIFTPKGMLILTEKFSSFTWKSSIDYRNVKEACEVWVTPKGKKMKKGLVGKIHWNGENNVKPSFLLGIDDSIDVSWKVGTTSTGKKFIEVESFTPLGGTEVKTTNPLMVNG